jgi:O-antigen/teichoic acid export membrane protein
VPQAIQPSTEKPDYFYLRYVTLGQLFKELKDLTPWWGCLSAVALAGAVFNLSAVPKIGSGALKQFLLCAVFAVFSWALRGKTIHMTFPKLSVVAWALLNICVGVGMIADALLPWWAATPFCWGLFLLCLVFWELVGLGRASYERTMPNAQAEIEA